MMVGGREMSAGELRIEETADFSCLGCAKQSNMEYILASGTSKLVAIALTYPYQVVRARIQVSQPITRFTNDHYRSSGGSTFRLTYVLTHAEPGNLPPIHLHPDNHPPHLHP